MKKFVYLLLVFCFLVQNSFGSPLIYKAEKGVTLNEGYVKIATFDASKYKQIRVVIINPSEKENSKYLYSCAVFGSEDGTSFSLFSADSRQLESTVVIDSPPTTVSVTVKGQGLAKVFVYGQ